MNGIDKDHVTLEFQNSYKKIEIDQLVEGFGEGTREEVFRIKRAMLLALFEEIPEEIFVEEMISGAAEIIAIPEESGGIAMKRYFETIDLDKELVEDVLTAAFVTEVMEFLALEKGMEEIFAANLCKGVFRETLENMERVIEGEKSNFDPETLEITPTFFEDSFNEVLNERKECYEEAISAEAFEYLAGGAVLGCKELFLDDLIRIFEEERERKAVMSQVENASVERVRNLQRIDRGREIPTIVGSSTSVISRDSNFQELKKSYEKDLWRGQEERVLKEKLSVDRRNLLKIGQKIKEISNDPAFIRVITTYFFERIFS